MSLDTLYRLFSHAALALSCACLLQSERQYMPGPELAIVPVAGVIFLAFFVERRWTLPTGGANLLAIVIALGGAWWLVMQIYSPFGSIELPMPTALVPNFGPIMMALLLVKLFRPREAGDFWVLQGIGLLQVALACVLASDPRFGLFGIAYLGCGLTALTLHHLTISAECTVRSAELRQPRTPLGPFLLRPLLWTLVVAGLGGALFLATPRAGWPSWNALTRFGLRTTIRAQTGYSDEINLNRTGELELDNSAAFSVTAVSADGQPFLDLAYDQRWRGGVLDVYYNGRWTLSEFVQLQPVAVKRSRFASQPLPDLGPERVLLRYQIVPRRAGGVFFADPSFFGPPHRYLPVGPIEPDGPLPFALAFGTLVPIPVAGRSEISYRQMTAPVAAPDHVPLILLDREYVPFLDYLQTLRAAPPEAIRTWTQAVLHRLVQARRYGLASGDDDLGGVRDDDGLALPPSAERVARALCAYLAESGIFTYSLDLRRADTSVDPAVDFLCNVHSGHCERFASALALMLRGCGIPTRVVKGFRGAEHQGEGVYVVRQRDAHSWVEVLVPRAASPTRVAQVIALGGSSQYIPLLAEALTSFPECDWIALDPTPPMESSAREQFSVWRWLLHQIRRADQLWQDLIVGFNGEHQADFWEGLISPRGPGRALLRLLALFLGFVALTWSALRVARWFLQRWHRWRARPALRVQPAPPSWLARLIGVLTGSLGIKPEPGQTPREIAACATAVLRGRPTMAALAELPLQMVEMYYRARYGGVPLSSDEHRRMEGELNRLETTLRAR